MKEKSEIQEKFLPKNIKARIIEKIERAYGKNHDIKLALFKPNSEYNDEGYDYNPSLILVDSKYDEIDHKVGTYELIPTYEESQDYYDETGEELTVDDVTIKF